MKNNETINFDSEFEISTLGQEEISKINSEFLQLEEDIDLFGKYEKERINVIKEYESDLKFLIHCSKKQFYDYLVSLILKIDEFSKEELISLKSKTDVFNNRINYLSNVSEECDEKIWNILSSNSKHWRIK